MEHLQDKTTVCLSGGADGADLEWGRCAGLCGHSVIHWTFHGHRSQAPENQLVRLDDEQLKIANEALQNAANGLGKSPPRRPTVARLLPVINEAPGLPVGGTAWATTMFAQLHPDNRQLYVFDQEKDTWLQFNGQSWDRIVSPPRPTGIWAGIGSRDLRQNGRDAIRKLMGCLNKES